MNVANWKSRFLWAPEDETGGGTGTTTGADTVAAGGEDTVSPGADTVAGGGDDTVAGPDFSFIGEDFHKDGQPDFTAFGTHYQDLLAEKAQRDEVLAKVPENGEYDFAIPDDFDLGVELPEGVRPEISTDDETFKPLFGELGAWMKENNLPSEAGQQVMGMLAKYEAARMGKNFAAANEQYEKLGPNDATRDARIGKVERALETALPKELVDGLKPAIRSYAGIRALEALIGRGGISTSTTTPKPRSVQEDMDAYYNNPAQ